MDVRPLTPEDAAAFQALRLKALQDSPPSFSSSHDEEASLPLAEIAAGMTLGPAGGCFGVFDGEELVGIAGLHRERERKLAHKATLWGVYLDPRYRGKGWARQLLHAALGHARTMPGLRQVNLSVGTWNHPARKLYESLGFEAFGVETGYLCVDGFLYDEAHMALRL